MVVISFFRAACVPVAAGVRCVLGAALLGASLSVGALTVHFSGSGTVSGPAQVPPLFTGLTVLPGSTAYTFEGVTGWTLASTFDFNVATLTGSGSATFAHGSDSLTATITSTTPALGAPLFLTYTVTGGTGAYAGLSGTGSSQTQLLGDPLGLPTPIPYVETAGVLTLAAIPEPSELALLGSGLGLIAVRLRRRRSARLADAIQGARGVCLGSTVRPLDSGPRAVAA